MKKSIGIVAALAVLGIAFYFSSPGIRVPGSDSEGLSLPPLTFAPKNLNINVPGISTSNEGQKAFATFAQYREFARTGNIEGVKSLSHQVSPACSDPARSEECSGLMASVYYFTEDFKEKEFKHVYFDNRQLVMFTDFLPVGESPDAEPVRRVLFFTRTGEDFKVLGIKFCLPDDERPETCFETNPAKRDTNNNGWWDQVESFFR